MNNLFILAFDHRSSFLKLLGLNGKSSTGQKEIAVEAKEIIFEGFRTAIKSQSVDRQNAAILVDEEFGAKIIEEARAEGYAFAVPVEASGKKEFEFEHGNNFGESLDKIRPNYVKALVRYNPEGDEQLNKRQAEKLSRLSEFCKDAGYQWMLEALIDPTSSQLKKANEEIVDFDIVLRPNLQVKLIKELQAFNVMPDIWKLEGTEDPNQYKSLVRQARLGDNEKVRAIVLGRGEDFSQVKKWLQAAKGIEGIAGFAVGRTIFTEPLTRWRRDVISHVEAVTEIAENYTTLYKIFN